LAAATREEKDGHRDGAAEEGGAEREEETAEPGHAATLDSWLRNGFPTRRPALERAPGDLVGTAGVAFAAPWRVASSETVRKAATVAWRRAAATAKIPNMRQPSEESEGRSRGRSSGKLAISLSRVGVRESPSHPSASGARAVRALRLENQNPGPISPDRGTARKLRAVGERLDRRGQDGGRDRLREDDRGAGSLCGGPRRARVGDRDDPQLGEHEVQVLDDRDVGRRDVDNRDGDLLGGGGRALGGVERLRPLDVLKSKPLVEPEGDV